MKLHHSTMPPIPPIPPIPPMSGAGEEDSGSGLSVITASVVNKVQLYWQHSQQPF